MAVFSSAASLRRSADRLGVSVGFWFLYLQNKVVKNSRKALEDDMELINKEKQMKMNELDVVVPLRLHQVKRSFIHQENMML